MSKKLNIKQANEILVKSQASVLERIENYRAQIKTVSERELAKSIIPVHEHKAGSVTGDGIEDIPYGKLNPRGVDKSDDSGLSPGGAATEMAMSEGKTMKAVKCAKCGEMHETMKKCGEMVKAKKSELIDAKGNRSSNSVVTPMPKTSVKQHGDKGGIVLPGAHLKKSEGPKACGDCGSSGSGQFCSDCGARKFKGAAPVKKAMTAGMGSGVGSTKVNDLGKAAITAMGGALSTKYPKMSAEDDKKLKEHYESQAQAHTNRTARMAQEAKNKPKTKKEELEKASMNPPTAKPPSGKMGATAAPPMSKPGNMKMNELEKGVFGDAIKQSHAPHPANATPKVTLPGAGAQAGRASQMAGALAGDFTPKAPVVSGLELATKKPAAPAAGLGLKSPKAAGVTPKASAAAPKKPGIFGKLFG